MLRYEIHLEKDFQFVLGSGDGPVSGSLWAK